MEPRPRRALCGLLTCAALSACFAAPLLGQEETGKRRKYDEVVRIIGDRVILRSTLDAEMAAQGADSLEPDKRRMLEREILKGIQREQIWIEHGKSAGEQSPREFERLVERQVDDLLRRDIRSSGSRHRFNEEMLLSGDSYSELRRSHRDRVLETLARQRALTALYLTQGLVVTPREMKAYYDANYDRFHQDPSADIAWVSFPIGGDVEASRAKALEAAAAWRAEDMSSTDLAERFGGIDLGIKANIRQDESDRSIDMLKEFAASGAVGDVSEPTRTGSFFAVLRVESKREAVSLEFENAQVQAEIRERIARERQFASRNEVLMRRSVNIYMWPPESRDGR